MCMGRPLQVGEIEEQLTAARRELARSEEANQKLQRDVKEVREEEELCSRPFQRPPNPHPRPLRASGHPIREKMCCFNVDGK